VRTGGPAYHEVFHRPFWEDLQAHPDLAASFDALMGPAGHGIPDPEVLVAGGWESVRTVVDVGGGTGSLLAEILRARPEVRGALVDLPPTVARSVEIFQVAGVAERVTAVGQSFFDPLPAGADLYLLKNVLGGWPDREAMAILRRCAEAARPAGRIGLRARNPGQSLSPIRWWSRECFWYTPWGDGVGACGTTGACGGTGFATGVTGAGGEAEVVEIVARPADG
jgi:SAM-dependent methyltransferase